MATTPPEQGSRAAAHVAQTAPAEVDIPAFANSCAAGDRVRCAARVERLRADGLQPDSVLMDLVAPAARYLGPAGPVGGAAYAVARTARRTWLHVGELRAQAFGAQAICLDPRESLKVARELVGR
jgi:hypothetical protein